MCIVDTSDNVNTKIIVGRVTLQAIHPGVKIVPM